MGLRERKKARTRWLIREHAMRLFEEQGFAATTVDQIAEAAEVSPSTFFRYYPAKEDVVLNDDYDPALAAALRAQPAEVPPVEAIRRSLHEVLDQLSEADWTAEKHRQQLIRSVPELRSRAMQQYTGTIRFLAAAVADRAGLPEDDFSAHVLAGAVVGALMAVLPVAERADFDRLDDAIELLQAGLPLGPAS